MTYTYALMAVSPSTYNEVKKKLLEAGYAQALHDDSDDEGVVLDMHGIALSLEKTAEKKSANLLVNGIVAQRNARPYIQLSNENGMLAQMTMSEARSYANDILLMCTRTEADAMIHRFFSQSGFPSGAGADLMLKFRDFRHELDMEKVEHSETDPDQ